MIPEIVAASDPVIDLAVDHLAKRRKKGGGISIGAVFGLIVIVGIVAGLWFIFKNPANRAKVAGMFNGNNGGQGGYPQQPGMGQQYPPQQMYGQPPFPQQPYPQQPGMGQYPPQQGFAPQGHPPQGGYRQQGNHAPQGGYGPQGMPPAGPQFGLPGPQQGSQPGYTPPQQAWPGQPHN